MWSRWSLARKARQTTTHGTVLCAYDDGVLAYDEVLVRTRPEKIQLFHPHILPLERVASGVWAAPTMGLPLQWVMRSRAPTPFSERASIRLVQQIASALGHIHALKCLHTVHSLNVFYHEGCTSLVDAPEPSVGTAFHARAPETILEKKHTSASDVWSLGCLLYELVTLRELFDRSVSMHYLKFCEWHDVGQASLAEDMAHLAQMQAMLGTLPIRTNRMYFSAKRKLCCAPHSANPLQTPYSDTTGLLRRMVVYHHRATISQILDVCVTGLR